MENQKIYDNCRLLLTKYPYLRNKILVKQRYWAYLEEFCGVKDTIIKEQYLKKDFPNQESIIRLMRDVQKDYPDLRGEVGEQQAAATLQEQHRKYFAQPQKPDLSSAEQFSKLIL